MLTTVPPVAEDRNNKRRQFTQDRPQTPYEDEQHEHRAHAQPSAHDETVHTEFSMTAMIRCVEDALFQRLEKIDAPKPRNIWTPNSTLNDNYAMPQNGEKLGTMRAANAYAKTAKQTMKRRPITGIHEAPEYTPKELYQLLLRLRTIQSRGVEHLDLDTHHDMVTAILGAVAAYDTADTAE